MIKQLVSSDRIEEGKAVKAELERVNGEIKAVTQDKKKAKEEMPVTPITTNRKSTMTSLSDKKSAKLYITCDNSYKVWLNGKMIGSGNDWKMLDTYKITIANNDTIAIEAIDGDAGNKSAGLYCCIVLEDDGKSWGIGRDWHYSSKTPEKDWQSLKSSFHSLLSVDNVHYAHKDRGERYQETNPFLQGSFVWSKNASKTIYVKEIISFDKFSKAEKDR